MLNFAIQEISKLLRMPLDLGSKYLNSKKQPSTVGDIGCLSFNGNKILTSGGGGMLVFKKKAHYNYGQYLQINQRMIL